MARVGRPYKYTTPATADKVQQRVKFLRGKGLDQDHIHKLQLTRPMTDGAFLVMTNAIKVKTWKRRG